MSGAFDPPPGDPAGVKTAAKQLHAVAEGLTTDSSGAKKAVSTALEQWHGKRTDDFREAGAGMQVELALALKGVGRVAEAVAAYGRALENTTQDVSEYHRQATGAMTDAKHNTRHLDPGSVQVEQMFQHAGTRYNQLEHQAMQAKSALATLAGKIAADIDATNDAVVPRSSTLSPDEIGRRVDSSTGVSGLRSSAADGTLTDAQAWAALGAAQKALPSKDVNSDGSVNWKDVLSSFNVTTGVGSAPPMGWALAGLVRTQRELGVPFRDLARPAHGLFDVMVNRPMLDVDRGLADIKQGEGAYSNFEKMMSSRSKFLRGGLPDTKFFRGLGRISGAAGAFGDVMTLINPGVSNQVEGGFLRGASAANLAGIGMSLAPDAAVLLGINGVADWIPGVGEVVMLGTGLFLAGDYIYHHWDQISHGASVAYHATVHGLDTAYHATTHGVSTAYHATTHAVSSAYHDTTHAVSSATKNVFTGKAHVSLGPVHFPI